MANFGWLIQLVGASWLMSTIGAGEEMVALVQTAVALPMMLFTLPAGAIADSFGRRKTVLVSQSIFLVVSTTLAITAFLGLITPWSLLGFTFLIGSCKAINHPGWQTYINEFVSREELPPAIALNSIGANLGRSVGPALGGVIVATIGTFAAFAINAIANLGVIASVISWPNTTKRATLPPEPIGAAIMAGVRYVALSRLQNRVLVRTFVFNVTGISLMALMPLIARDVLGGGARVYGLLFSSFGVGAICGALVSGRFRARFNREHQARVGFVTFAVSLAGVALSEHLALSMMCVAICGGAWILTQTGLNSAIQMSSPRWVVSRCISFYQSAHFAGAALGGILWGTAAGQLGVQGALLLSATSVVLISTIGFMLPLKDFDMLGLDPHTVWSPPNREIEMVPNSGPIIVTRTYHVRQEDIPQFLRLMSRRRRQQIRDGARQWTLSRDIRQRDVWYERYKSSTWTEIERYHSRRTVSGANIGKELRALHQGAEKPIVSYELVRHPEQEPTPSEPPRQSDEFPGIL